MSTNVISTEYGHITISHDTHLDFIQVKEKYQRKGYGSKLFKLFLKEYKKDIFTMEIHLSADKAIGFWNKMFEEHKLLVKVGTVYDDGASITAQLAVYTKMRVTKPFVIKPKELKQLLV